MPISSHSRLVATDDQVSTTVGDEVVILGMHDGVYYGLDEVGARVWPLLRTPIVVSAIVSAIVSEFDVDHATCERDVLRLLDDLVARGLAREMPPAEPGRT